MRIIQPVQCIYLTAVLVINPEMIDPVETISRRSRNPQLEGFKDIIASRLTGLGLSEDPDSIDVSIHQQEGAQRESIISIHAGATFYTRNTPASLEQSTKLLTSMSEYPCVDSDASTAHVQAAETVYR